MKKRFVAVVYSLIVILALQSCQKEVGYGGNEGIVGKVKAKYYNRDFSVSYGEDYVANYFVYIIFGDDPSYGDRIKTSYDGTFFFKHLKPGNYRLFVYSEDTSRNSSDPIPIIKDVSLTTKSELMDVGTFSIAKIDYSGDASISGKLKLRNYNSNFTIVANEYYYPDEYVYLAYEDDVTYKTRIKTGYDGSFEFKYLLPGSYRVYAYSKDTTMSSYTEIPVIINTSISTKNEHVDIGEIVVADNKIEGHASIAGKIRAIDYKDTTNVYYIGYEKVFIVYNNNENFATYVRTNYTGDYKFVELPIGHYQVYAYTKDFYKINNGIDYAVITEVEVTEINQTITLPDIVIYK